MVKPTQRTDASKSETDAQKIKDGRMQGDMLDNSKGPSAAHVDPRVQTEIGKQLRAIYDDVINEPVPSKFMDLLEQLERSTSRKN